jgi:hypothetical protein
MKKAIYDSLFYAADIIGIHNSRYFPIFGPCIAVLPSGHKNKPARILYFSIE